MRMTLLDMTQNIMSAMNSDEVNSISDTVESMQVAEVIRTTYMNMATRMNLPKQRDLFSLTDSGDSDLPVLMYKPENVDHVEWIKYDTSEDVGEPNFSYVTILPIDQFLDMQNSLDIDETWVENFTLNGQEFKFRNDTGPRYCTILKNYYIIFDAFNEGVDSTLQASKTQCFGELSYAFTMDDGFVPEMDSNQFPLLLNEAKSLAFMEIKQTPHQKAEIESRRQWRSLQNNKKVYKTSDFDQLADFGRRSNGYFRSRRFRSTP